jgi:iron(III) transport system ATP-binding protein
VLLDEPFSNLDVEVRLRLRSELPGVLSACGASGLLVTHDPEEALAICGRVAILRDGQLHQCATPRELVEAPATPFVGRFVLQRNVLPVWRDGATSLLRCLEPDAAGDACVMGREFLGRSWLYRIQLGDQQLRLIRPLGEDHQRGLRCRLSLQQHSEVLLHPQCLSLQVLP